MNGKRIAALSAACALGGGLLAATVSADGSSAPSHPAVRVASPRGIDPADFAHPKRNPYFPLDPGLVTLLRGTDEGEHFHQRVAITHRTRMIQGVRVRVVKDVVRRADGTLAERTHDWYAADNEGNV